MKTNINGIVYFTSWVHSDTANRSTDCFVFDDQENFIAEGVAYKARRDNYCKNTGRKVSLAKAITNFPKEIRKQFWESYFKMRNGKY